MQKSYLIVSIETTIHSQDNEETHRLFNLTFAQFDYEGNEITKEYRLIKPTDFNLSAFTEATFNINQRYLLEHGEYSYSVLSDFEKVVQESSLIIGYELAQTLRVIENEYQLNGMDTSIYLKTRESLDSEIIWHYCSPAYNLKEIHHYLFGEHFQLSPLDLSIKCFFELKRRKVI